MAREERQLASPVDWVVRAAHGKVARQDRDSVDKRQGGGRKYTSVTITDDRAYMPASSAQVEEVKDAILQKLGEKNDDISGTQSELLEAEYQEVEVKASKVHIISLCVALVLASLLIFTGVIAPLINGLPHRLFWLSMGFPAAGVAAGNMLILLGGREEKD